MTLTAQLFADRIAIYYKKYERWVPAGSFVLGFLFDILTLSRIDDVLTIFQQGIYLLITVALLGVEIIGLVREVPPPPIFKKVWQYREFALHFLLGTLLSSYVLFYFKSASGATSFLFIGILAALLTVNEFMRFGQSQVKVHMALISLCLISFLESLVPTLLGFIGIVPFLLGLVLSIGAFYGFYRFLRPRLSENRKLLRTHVLYPYSAVHSLFVILYLMHAIPPVPLSVSYMGIYHGVEKKNGNYVLTYTRPWWKFWENGDETFLARPGDSLVGFAQVFSPTRFKDKLQIRWLSKNARGHWEPQDAIPLEVSGGREEGYRVAITKKNYHPGIWRVQIETTDNREVGRLGFSIIADPSTEARKIRTAIR